MAYILQQEDLQLVLQQSAYRTSTLKVEVLDLLDNNKLVGTIEGLVSGTNSIDGSSDIRRTANLVIQPTLTENIKLEENNLLWLNKGIKLYIGLWNFRLQDFKWYSLGYYVYTDMSVTYDATNNQLTVNCADYMKLLDGSKRGQLGGASTIKYPAYLEDDKTGESIQYYHIRNAVIETLETLARITNHRIDDIGEYYAFPDRNDNWQQYRENNPGWNCIPYDIEFSLGTNVLSIINELANLYPEYEKFFEPDNNTFILQMKPTCYDDDIFITNDFIQKVLISENTSVDMTSVRNICEVWGKVIETDFYADESVILSGDTYNATIEGYEEQYYNGDTIALKIHNSSPNAPKVNINDFGAIGIYDEATDKPLEEGRLKAENVYSLKVKKKRVNGNDVIKLHLLGQWQVHALDVLTDGSVSNTIMYDSDGQPYNLYSKEYFKKWYNVETVNLQIIPNSPFTVQKLGEILDVKSSGEYENITSDDLAADRARWENWKNCRLTDNITITTALLPFMDVNKKISYRPYNSKEEYQYIIQSVSHDFAGYKTTISMYRFYPLYIPDNDENKLHGGE